MACFHTHRKGSRLLGFLHLSGLNTENIKKLQETLIITFALSEQKQRGEKKRKKTFHFLNKVPIPRAEDEVNIVSS